MDKTSLNDKRLSWKAKGIMAFMLSKPDDWVFYKDELATNSTDGKASFKSGFDELKEYGYVKHARKHNENGKFTWETTVFETPSPDFPSMDKPFMENPSMENRPLLSNEELSNELTKNDKDIYALYDHWNEQGIIKHKRMNQAMKSSTKARLEDYSIDELLKAIDNYTEILSSTKYYWTHKWTYQEFMKPNNVIRFLDEVDPKSNFSTEEIKQAKPTKGFQKSKEQLEHEQMLKEVGFFN